MSSVKRAIYNDGKIIGYIIETVMGKNVIVVSDMTDSTKEVLEIRKSDEEKIVVDEYIVDVLIKALNK